MRPRLLNRYIGRRFLATLAIILTAVFVIVFIADYVEILRRYGDEPGFTALTGVRLGLMRAPALMESILPFAFLFAALLSLLGLSRKLELVVARASGISVWGFLAAPFALAILLGLASVLLLNPLAVALNEKAEVLQATLSTPGNSNDESRLWFRQGSGDGPSIMSSARATNNGLALHDIAAFVFDADGAFREKVTAAHARYSSGEWLLADATVRSAARAPQMVETYRLPTNLTAEEIRETVAQPEALSFWSLPSFIATGERTGLSTERFRLAFHALLARPLFLLAMVAIAATVSLRLSRYGGAWRLVLTGVGAGFLLYVLTEIVGDLGGNGIIDPVLAAWSPSIIALTFGATVLFHQEDG